MNPYLAELKKITDNYENYQRIEDLQQHLYALTSMISNDIVDESKTPIKASDFVTSIVGDFFNANPETEMVKTGFTAFDRISSGFQKGEFVVIGGRPGMGKTVFMVQMAANIARQNKGVAFLSLEMSAEMMTKKFLCNLGQLKPDVFNRLTDYTKEIELNLSDAIKQLKELPIFLYENPSTYLNKLLPLIRKVVEENEVRVVFIDYIQLVSVGNRRFNREAEISIVCREIKKLAVELNITIIAGSQLSRQVENRPGGSKRPQLSDLRESGSIEQDADKVIFLYRPEYYGIEVDECNQPTKNRMELILSKNRNGPIVDIPVSIAFHKSIVRDIDYNQEDIYMRTPDIKIDVERFKDFDNDKDEVF
jgi:replicative DNA helicase